MKSSMVLSINALIVVFVAILVERPDWIPAGVVLAITAIVASNHEAQGD